MASANIIMALLAVATTPLQTVLVDKHAPGLTATARVVKNVYHRRPPQLLAGVAGVMDHRVRQDLVVATMTKALKPALKLQVV